MDDGLGRAAQGLTSSASARGRCDRLVPSFVGGGSGGGGGVGEKMGWDEWLQLKRCQAVGEADMWEGTGQRGQAGQGQGGLQPGEGRADGHGRSMEG